MVDYPVPKTQIDTLKGIIEGFYEAGEVGELVEEEDVEEFMNNFTSEFDMEEK